MMRTERVVFLSSILSSIAIALALGLSGAVITRRLSATTQQQMYWDLASDIAWRLPPIAELSQGPSEVELELHAILPDASLYIVDLSGRVVYPAGESLARTNIHLAPVYEALQAEAPSLPLLGDDPQSLAETLPFSVAEIADSDRTGFVYVTLRRRAELIGAPDRPLWSSAVELLPWFAPGIGVMLITTFVLSALVTRGYRRIVEMLGRYAVGDYTSEVAPVGQDEISLLTGEIHEVARLAVAQTEELALRRTVRQSLLLQIGHDLRGPLTGAAASIESLLAHPGDLPRVKSLLDVLRGSLETHRQFSRSLGRVSELEAMTEEIRPERVSVPQIASALVRRLQEQAGRSGIALIHTAHGADREIVADRTMIERVLENLVGNALRFTPEGGTVTIDTTVVEHGVSVAVEDTGAGMQPEDLQGIFLPFFRASNRSADRGTGTGLGLAIVRRLLELHGTSVEVGSRPGEGTIFRFTLFNDIPSGGGADSAPRLHLRPESTRVHSPFSGWAAAFAFGYVLLAALVFLPLRPSVTTCAMTLILGVLTGAGLFGPFRSLMRILLAASLASGTVWWCVNAGRFEIVLLTFAIGIGIAATISRGYRTGRHTLLSRIAAIYVAGAILSGLLYTYALYSYWTIHLLPTTEIDRVSSTISQTIRTLAQPLGESQRFREDQDFRIRISQFYLLNQMLDLHLIDSAGKTLLSMCDENWSRVLRDTNPLAQNCPQINFEGGGRINSSRRRVPLRLGDRDYTLAIDFPNELAGTIFSKADQPYLTLFWLCGAPLGIITVMLLFRAIAPQLAADLTGIRAVLAAFRRGDPISEQSPVAKRSAVAGTLANLAEIVQSRAASIAREDLRIRELADSTRVELEQYLKQMETLLASAEREYTASTALMIEHTVDQEIRLVRALYLFGLLDSDAATPSAIDCDAAEILEDAILETLGFAHSAEIRIRHGQFRRFPLRTDRNALSGALTAIFHALVRQSPPDSEIYVTMNPDARTIDISCSPARFDGELGWSVANGLLRSIGMSLRALPATRTGLWHGISIGLNPESSHSLPIDVM